MKRIALALLILSIFPLLGCDGEAAERKAREAAEKARQAATQASAKLSEQYEQAGAVAHARQFASAVEQRRLDDLQRLCQETGNAEYRAVMGGYYEVFAIEHKQGVAPARQHLADELARDDLPPLRRKSLEAMNGYFDAKGSLMTRELAGMILIMGLEHQYPHVGGRVGKLIAEKAGLLDDPTAATQPEED